MLYLGIDIAKLNHVASLINSDGKLIFSNFKFQNNFNGFNSLIQKLSSFDLSNLIIGIESTSHYGENFINFFFPKSYNIALINPLQTNALRKTSIRDTKNDRIDSINIAKFLLIGYYRLITDKDINVLNLKRLNRFRDKLIKQRSKCKIQLVYLIDLAFPELQYEFCLHSNAIYTLLSKAPCAEDIAALRIDSLTKLLKNNSRGHFNRNTAEKIKSLAKSSVGHKDFSISIEIPQLIQLIELLDSQVKEIKSNIDKILIEIDSIITTIPGISNVAAAGILGEIGDIDNFKNSSKLLAFAGLDPKVRQSGNFNALSTRMSKRGSRYLRQALIYTSWNIVRNNDKFKIYYQLKRSQGKSHYKALGHVAHKLVRVIFKLLKFNIPFDNNYLE